MNIGLGLGAKGDPVAQLQTVLASTGQTIERSELDGQEFGASTLAALHAFQTQNGLPATASIDAPTLAILESRMSTATGDASAIVVLPRGTVEGQLVDGDAAPIAGAALTLVGLQLRAETTVGKSTTDASGRYSISYQRAVPLNLVVRAMDAAGKLIATSATVFAAPAIAEINLTTAADGIVPTPSHFTRLSATVNAGLGGAPMQDLQENKDKREVTFLARATGVSFNEAAYLFIAHVLALKTKLSDETLFGLFASGLPANLDAALDDLPDAGIDATFTAQVLSGILAQPQATLAKNLGTAVASNVLPASYGATQESELATLAALRAVQVGGTRYIRGKTPLNALLAAGAVKQPLQTAFVQAYANAGGRLGPTWKALRADKTLPKADLAQLNTVLSAGELLTGNLLLVKDTLQRLQRGSLARLQDLALLDQADWEARIKALDPNAATIPQVLPNDTAADRIARFAKSLAYRFARRFPTTAFAGGLSKAATSSFKTKNDLVTFLTANPKLNIRRGNIDRFIATNNLKPSPALVAELKTAQRLHRVSPHYASIEALHAAGYTSAQSIYFKGRAPFLVQMTTALGSKGMAAMAYARSQMVYGTALAALGRYNLSFNGVTPASMALARPDPGTLANLPDIQALFGSLDYFQCRDCQSIYSPAAYLVDLLQFLGWFAATPPPGATPPMSTVATARDVLLLRRPDIQYVALDCDNTSVVIPYIDLVNEILEAAIAPAAIARPTVVQTIGTTASLRALPQRTQPQVAAAAYAATGSAVFPLALPFDVNFARVAAYVAALGTTRARLLRLFPATGAAVIAGAALGLNPSMQAIVGQANTTDPWTRWGLAQAPASVIDPKTRLPYSPNPADWVAALSKVPVLLNRGGLTLPELSQLLEVVWVTRSTVTLQLGTATVAGEQVLSSDTDAMTFTGLTGEVLDRANRFLRLWRATGLTMWELDWALDQAAGGALDDKFLVLLAEAVEVQRALHLTFPEVLAFWALIGTRDVVSHLGDEDTRVPSTYSEVFASPTMLTAWGNLFADPSGLSGAKIIYDAAATPTAAQLQPLNGITAALGLSATDIAAILAASNAANALTLGTLTTLLRYARLAAALSLTPSDLILWIALTGAMPFGGAPADTQEFLRRLSVLKATGIAVQGLDYLLRGGSAAESTLAFTETQAATVLQAIRDAIAKAVVTNQIALTSVVNGTPIAIVTAKPHGLQTGQRVLITGVEGTTAANGISAITVTGPTGFTLNGSAGNAAWTGGGAATANLDATVETIVVAALATAAGVTADVVIPVLGKSGVLPLDAATIANLLAQATVDPSQFPALVTAATRVAKAGALFTALATTPQAFAFLVRNAATFRWLDPSALPLAPVTASPYDAFEALLRALALEQRQTGRSSKLFDVLGAWLVPGGLPADLATAIGGTSPDAPSLARALNGGIADVTAIAAQLGATAPSLDPVHQTGSLTDIATLARIADALDIIARYKIGGATLLLLAAAAPGADSADAAMGVLQAQYPQSSWFAAVQPVEDALRQTRRDALVAYLLGPGPTTSPAASFLTDGDIFDYYLIDPEMCPCGETTRLLQPSLAIQQFVQQCFLNIGIGATVDTTDARWSEWSWRQQYRLWQANRQVFLYPENYLLPELRPDASPFFRDLSNDLRQTNCDADAVETAFGTYLRKLLEVSRLVVAAHYNETKPDGSKVLHVFARTRGTPSNWFYRSRTSHLTGSGRWNAWIPLDLDIPAGHLMPVIWDRRLYLVWPTFKEQSERPRDQTAPTAGGGTAPTAQKYWAVAFAFSEFSAGQWQPKRTTAEKVYFIKTLPGSVAGELPPEAFVFRVFQTPTFDLQIDAYWNVSKTSPSIRVATATLSMPEAPMAVVGKAQGLLPSAAEVDLAQEPSFALIAKQNLSGSLTTPTGYGYSGQDIVYGDYTSANPGTVPLDVLSQTGSGGQVVNEVLLGTIVNPRLTVPQQETVFDSMDPFFVSDRERSYLVQPHYYTVSSSPQELEDLTYVPQWTTRYAFETFYHPYARTFLRELEIGGVPRLMSRNLQLNPQGVRGAPTAFSFQSLYAPQPPVAAPYPGTANAPDPGETALDFSPGSTGAYSLYNWEVFYHLPMYVASLLLQNQKYQDATTWLKYVFDPTDSTGGSAPQRFWEMAPLNAMNAADWANQAVQALLTALAANTQQGIADPTTQNAILAWMADPFDPHKVAETRISSYGRATVMRFLDTLIAWGDSLYAQHTSETVAQAEQLYILAEMILGPKPDMVRLPAAQQGAVATYASLHGLDLFSNILVNVENVVVAPEPPDAVIQGSAQPSPLPALPGTGSTLLFCIPPNTQLLGYWDKVAQRLYNIRHCLNLQGVAQPLPLYAPPLNPMQLVAGEALGGGGVEPVSSAPIYRFSTYLQKAIELANDVRSYGSLILSALEKQDAETLAALRARQELGIQTRMLDVKTQQVTEAQDQVTALRNQQQLAQIRYDFYSGRPYMNAWETAALALQVSAAVSTGASVILDMTAGTVHLMPTVNAGVAGAFGTPNVTASLGGSSAGSSSEAWAKALRGLAEVLGQSAGMAATQGGYQRRQDEWTLQANLAQAELTQIASQITAATDRLAIANSEFAIQNAHIANAQAVSNFLTGKYTDAQLYAWMVTQLTTVHAQAYQLAFSLAQQAQSAYQYELGRPGDQFLQFAYWDSQYKGLTAGESLLFDLRRMEAQYLASNLRELELTKHVSLVLTQPDALLQLLETGSCSITLDESLFDRDHPGQYFRRLRSVALTIPCVTGPFTGVNATLAMGSAVIRTLAPSANYTPWRWANSGPGSDPAISASPPAAAMPVIATSTGRDDAGLFDVNLRDERWLPFEGQGAVSTWSLTLDPRDNNFDLSSITDVVLHIRYTARPGGDAEAVRTALKPDKARSVLVSSRSVFGTAFYRFFRPVESTAVQETLILPLTDAIFPFSNLGTPRIKSVAVIMALKTPMSPALAAALGSGLEIDGTFGPSDGSVGPASIKLTPIAGTTAGGGPVAALSSGAIAQATPAAPTSFSLTIPQSAVPVPLQAKVDGQTRFDQEQIHDILLLIAYEID
ncbi:MAG TPA: neuraminidase-like domain-containing protein [Acetobacteraceae bacterium]|nr:neuraminidase-like domain-containing protein [Acetobacteraceae bacterium]